MWRTRGALFVCGVLIAVCAAGFSIVILKQFSLEALIAKQTVPPKVGVTLGNPTVLTLNVRCPNGTVMGTITVTQGADEKYEVFLERAATELAAAVARLCR